MLKSNQSITNKKKNTKSQGNHELCVGFFVCLLACFLSNFYSDRKGLFKKPSLSGGCDIAFFFLPLPHFLFKLTKEKNKETGFLFKVAHTFGGNK